MPDYRSKTCQHTGKTWRVRGLWRNGDERRALSRLCTSTRSLNFAGRKAFKGT